jgi:hypothetical protein
MLKVEVVYANVQTQTLLSINVAENSSVQQAIEQSGILQKHPEINLQENKVGIYSELVSLDTKVNANDRIEIYRPLNVDPIEARRLRAKKAKACK